MGKDGTTVNADGASRPGTSEGDASGISEGRFRALLANVADMVTISDRDGRIIYASPATEKVSGYTPEEFMARNPFDSIHPDDHPKCAEAFEKLANTPGLSLDLEHRVRHKDGGWQWVEGTFTSLFDDPDVGGLLATVRDITGRKRADEVLRESEEQQAFLLKLSDALRKHGDPMKIQAVALRVLGEHLGVDRVFYAEVDVERDEYVIRKNYAKGVPPLIGNFRLSEIRRTAELAGSGQIVIVENADVDPRLSESERASYAAMDMVSAIGVPLIKDGRWVVGFGVQQATPRKWTPEEIRLVRETAERTWPAVERARAEESLRDSETRFRAAYEQVNVGIVQSTVEGRILFPNPGFCSIIGYTEEQAKSLTVRDITHPDDYDADMEQTRRVIAGEIPGYTIEKRFVREDGEVVWVQLTSTLVRHASGEPDYALAVVEDINERKRAEELLRRAADVDVFRVALADALSPLTDPAEIQAASSRVLGEHLAVDRVMYADVDEQRGEVVSADNYVKDGVSKLVGRFSTKDFGQTIENLRAAQIVSSSDTRTDATLSEPERASWDALGIVSFLAVPLVKGGRWVSNFGIHHFSPREWSENDILLVQETAERTWAAVERARAEKALRGSEARLHLALDSAQMGTFLWHVEEDRGEPDAQMLALFGLPDDGTLSLAEALDRLIHPYDRAGYEEAVLQATDPAGDGRLREDIRVVHPDGSERWLAITAQTVFETRPSRAVQMSGVATDITERRRAEAEGQRLRTRGAAMRAEMAERERISRELHDRVAHSMGVVYQSLQLHKALAENDPARAREKLAVAEETARNALDQTRNLAIELRRSVSSETENGVATALRTLIETSAPDGVDAGFSFSGDESTLPRDVGAQVYLVMREAIRNALKHSACEVLQASLEIRPGELVGTVTDDGDGFDPNAASDDGRGLGLGSMRERAEMVGGQLDLTSEPGEGTTMEIRVPLIDR